MSVIYFDWSIRRGVVWSSPGDDGMLDGYEISARMRDLLNRVTEPTTFICEATFGSFYLPERQEFIRRCAEEGHTILTVPTRVMTRLRYKYGFVKLNSDGKPKAKQQSVATDFEDILCMKWYGDDGGHYKRPNVPDPEQIKLQGLVNGELMRLRSTGHMEKKPRSEGFNFFPEKDRFARELVSRLPAFSSLTPVQQIALGDGKGNYSLVLVATTGVIAKYARNRRDFDFLSGLYVHAYGSQARADYMHWGWAGGNKRQNLNKETRKRDDLTLSDYRRELRWLYHHLKN